MPFTVQVGIRQHRTCAPGNGSMQRSHKLMPVLDSGSMNEYDGRFERVARSPEDEHMQSDGVMALGMSLASSAMRSSENVGFLLESGLFVRGRKA